MKSKVKSQKYRVTDRGFTLIELLVSITIFSFVMLIAVGSLLSMIDANRKAQSLKSVVNNLSFALDSLGRTLREGSSYHCGGAPFTSTADCAAAGDTVLALERFGGSSSSAGDQVVYCLGSGSTCSSSGSSLLRSTDGGSTYLPLTAPEVVIQKLRFYVVGSARVEVPKIQPKIVMVLQGYTGQNQRTRTDIKLQTTITPRLYDQ
jgi:prepilin-type N-terminal cleavage/methylation domain-containing protein